MQVETLEAKAGRKGHIRLKGSLPVGTIDSQEAASGQLPGLHLDVQALELRSRSLYTGTQAWPRVVGQGLAGQQVQVRCRSAGLSCTWTPEGLGVWCGDAGQKQQLPRRTWQMAGAVRLAYQAPED